MASPFFDFHTLRRVNEKIAVVYDVEPRLYASYEPEGFHSNDDGAPPTGYPHSGSSC